MLKKLSELRKTEFLEYNFCEAAGDSGAITIRTESMMHTQVLIRRKGMRWLACTAVSV